MSPRASFVLAASFVTAGAVLGCKVKGTGASGGSSPPSACVTNQAVMTALAPTCAGCHGQGARPFFASLSAFENQLVYDTTYVVPGHPEQSYLMSLLQGTATGTYTQMPLAGASFAKLSAEGETQITIEAVSNWITGLTAQPMSSAPNVMAVTTQRKSAEQIQASLWAQLGLSSTDFFVGPVNYEYGTPTLNAPALDTYYPVWGADAPDWVMQTQPAARHAQLGGAQSLDGRARDPSPSPPFALALIGISQSWCKLAIAKSTNQILFPMVAPSAPSAGNTPAIKANIGYLALHFLGDPASDADVDDVFNSVFLPIEAGMDAPTAWAGVCSYFIRHPKAIFF
jgi:hypothetical protein